MINQQLLDYVRAQRSAGLSKEAITQALAAGGWTQTDVTEAFMALDGVKTPPPPPPPSPTAAPMPPRVIVPPPTTPPIQTGSIGGAAMPTMAPVSQPRPSFASAEFSTAPVRRRSSLSFYILLLILIVLVGGGAAIYLNPSLLNSITPYFKSFFPEITKDEDVPAVNQTPVNPLPMASSTDTTLVPQSTTTPATTTAATSTKPAATSTKTR